MPWVSLSEKFNGRPGRQGTLVDQCTYSVTSKTPATPKPLAQFAIGIGLLEKTGLVNGQVMDIQLDGNKVRLVRSESGRWRLTRMKNSRCLRLHLTIREDVPLPILPATRLQVLHCASGEVVLALPGAETDGGQYPAPAHPAKPIFAPGTPWDAVLDEDSEETAIMAA